MTNKPDGPQFRKKPIPEEVFERSVAKEVPRECKMKKKLHELNLLNTKHISAAS